MIQKEIISINSEALRIQNAQFLEDEIISLGRELESDSIPDDLYLEKIKSEIECYLYLDKLLARSCEAPVYEVINE